jgi:transcriptional regulator GlxA family with amidase domain
MQQNIEVPVPVAALAGQMQVARRTLERRFLADLGQTPAKVYLDLRLDRALLRLRTTEEPVSEIGLSTGFCDGTHLARVLKAHRGVSPAEYRKARRIEDAAPAVGVLLNAKA